MDSTNETTQNHFESCPSPAGGNNSKNNLIEIINNCFHKDSGTQVHGDSGTQVHTSPLIGLEGKTKLVKRARKYHISKTICAGMKNQNPGENLTKRLNRALKCGVKIRLDSNGKPESRYCGTRFCQVCNGIRTNILMERLSREMQKSPRWHMVVLSVQNCEPRELRGMIEHYKDNWIKINKWFKNNKCTKGNGFYTYEITHNAVTNTFHPHIHILIDNDVTANIILDLWLKLNAPGKNKYYALRDKGNKVLEMNPGQNKEQADMILELIKYATKPGKSDKESGNIYINSKALVTIYEALEGFQVFQTFGTFRSIKDLTEEELSEEVKGTDDLVDASPGIYDWCARSVNWISRETGEFLTDNKKRVRIYDNGKYISRESVKILIEKLPNPG